MHHTTQLIGVILLCVLYFSFAPMVNDETCRALADNPSSLPTIAVSAGRASPLCAWERSQPLLGLRFDQVWHQLPAGAGVLPPGVRGEAYRRAGFAACARGTDCIAPHTRGQQLARLSAG